MSFISFEETLRMPATSIPSCLPCDGTELHQGPMAFEEVAVVFTEEEWALLDPDQRALHKEVMEENWQMVSSLDNWREKNVCPKCGKTFMLRLELAEKQRTYIKEQEFTQEKNYNCIVCGKYFSMETASVFRKKDHIGNKLIVNEVPVNLLDTKLHFVSHQILHIGGKPYQCKASGNWFAQNSHFEYHNRVHAEEKLYKCFECGKCFAHNSLLVRHKRVHTGEKPYNCLDCGKSFAQFSHLAFHKRLHTGEKPYRCQECGKCFAHNSYLVKHKRVHTGEKPYKCQECTKCFAHSSHLVMHKRIHIGEKSEIPGV